MAAVWFVLVVVGLTLLAVDGDGEISWFRPKQINPSNPVNPYVYGQPPPLQLPQPRSYPYDPLPNPIPTVPSRSRCNPAVMAAIKKQFWNVYGVPQNVISRFISNEKEKVLMTSRGYYPDSPSCVYSHFFTSYFTISKVSKNGYTSSEIIKIIEVEGSLYDPDEETLRVTILVYGGASLIYTCSLADNAVYGPAEGLVKYRELNSALSFAYFQAPQLMQSVGITLTDEYALDC